MVLLGQPPSEQTLYDVSDPIHPRLLCRIDNTSAHIYSGDTIVYLRSSASATSVVLRSLGSGDESLVATIPRVGLEPRPLTTTAWVADGSLAATAMSDAGGTIQVSLFSPAFTGPLYSFPSPQVGCICRFGIPLETLAFSPDRQYLVSGWPLPGSSPFAVFRVSDRARVAGFDSKSTLALWDRTGHRLFLSGTAGIQAWTPEAGLAALSGARMWQYMPGLSPDGGQAAYTAYSDMTNETGIGIYAYSFGTNSTRPLVAAGRSQVVFIKDGWVWYLDEPACDPAQNSCGPWGSQPSGKVFAMNLSTGVEQQVSFASGEDPFISQGYSWSFAPGEFWPNS